MLTHGSGDRERGRAPSAVLTAILLLMALPAGFPEIYGVGAFDQNNARGEGRLGAYAAVEAAMGGTAWARARDR